MIKSSFVWKYRVLATELLITLGKSVDIDLFFVFITIFYIKGNQYIRDAPVIGYIHCSTLDCYILLIYFSNNLLWTFEKNFDFSLTRTWKKRQKKFLQSFIWLKIIKIPRYKVYTGIYDKATYFKMKKKKFSQQLNYKHMYGTNIYGYCIFMMSIYYPQKNCTGGK